MDELRSVVTFGARTSFTQYFYIALKFVFLLARVTLLFKCWRRRAEFLEIANFILDESNPFPVKNIHGLHVALLTGVALGSSFLVAMFCWISGMLLPNRDKLFSNG